MKAIWQRRQDFVVDLVTEDWSNMLQLYRKCQVKWSKDPAFVRDRFIPFELCVLKDILRLLVTSGQVEGLGADASGAAQAWRLKRVPASTETP